MKFWTGVADSAFRFPKIALEAESRGWDGIGKNDSQNLSSDPYVCLALAAQASEKLGLMTSVTNVGTRTPAVTATAALTIQSLSRGRMVIGIGRGDSALAHLGRAPARLGWFEDYLAALQTYLRGDEVDFSMTGISDQVAPPIDSLGLADAPTSSAIAWAKGRKKVPVEVAASGPRVIRIAARQADRVMFALGASPERIAWGIETARIAATAAGRDPDSLQFGAYVSVVCHEDLSVARDLGRASATLFARFSVMHGTVSGPANAAQRTVFKNLYDRYDMKKHSESDGDQITAMTDEFMDSFAVVGGVDHCIRRLSALAALGIDKFAIGGPSFNSSSADGQVAAANFVDKVMPALRS